jgi:hypothetical protein
MGVLDGVILDYQKINPDDLGLFSYATGIMLLSGMTTVYFLSKTTDFANMLTGGQASGMGALAQSIGSAGSMAARGAINNKATRMGRDYVGGKVASGVINAYSKMRGL